MKRIISFLLALCVVFSSFELAMAEEEPESAGNAESEQTPAITADNPLGLIGASAILIDATTGEILYEKNADEKHFPASTTKIMTAILTLEELDLDHVITVDKETPFTEGSRIYLVEGEKLSVKELLYGMMLESANDVAVAFAKEISGSTEAFAKRMNQKAKELGTKNTNFVNPNGLHDEAHVSTAYDLAMIAKYAMKNKTFRKYCSTYQHNIEATGKQEKRYLYNTNRLLYDSKHMVTVNGKSRPCKYDGVTGIKTGYTSNAGGCLVAGAERNGTELIAVIMKSTDMGRFQDCIALLDYGFENYKTAYVLDGNEDMGNVRVKHGAVRNVKAIPAEEVAVTLSSDMSEKLLKTKVKLNSSVKAPVKKGQVIGSVAVTDGAKEIRTIDLVAANNVKKGGILSYIGIPDNVAKWIFRIFFGILGALFLLLVLYILIKRHQVKMKKKRRAARRAAQKRLEEERKKAWEQEYWKNRM